MDFNFTDEQNMLRDTVAKFVQQQYDFDTRRAIVKSEAGWRRDYWTVMAEELGILGAPFTEDQGGLGQAQAAGGHGDAGHAVEAQAAVAPVLDAELVEHRGQRGARRAVGYAGEHHVLVGREAELEAGERAARPARA